VSNFGLTLLAARLLGPRGLGVVVVGFALYLVALSFQRTLISQPLVISSSTRTSSDRSNSTACSVTVTLLLGLTAAILLAGFGWLLGGTVGHGLVMIGPWLVPALLQDHWRAVLFRDQRGMAAAVNDGVWILGMIVSLPLAWWLHTTGAVIACWGAGAALGAGLGVLQTKVPMAAPTAAWEWWRRVAWPMGRWLASEGTVYLVISQSTLFVLVGILGTAPIGGYRAVATIFAPLTLLRPAVALPGLPAMTSVVSSSEREGRRTAAKWSAALAALTATYVLLLATRRHQLLVLAFGPSFGRFAGLVLPIGIEEIFNALGIGFSLFLKASRQGKPILWSTAIGETSTLIAASVLAIRYGLSGAAWGMTAAAALECAAVLYFSLMTSTRRAPEQETGIAH